MSATAFGRLPAGEVPHPDDEGGESSNNIYQVEEEDHRPPAGLPSRRVHRGKLIEIGNVTLGGVVVLYDLWFLMLALNLGIMVLGGQL